MNTKSSKVWLGVKVVAGVIFLYLLIKILPIILMFFLITRQDAKLEKAYKQKLAHIDGVELKEYKNREVYDYLVIEVEGKGEITFKKHKMQAYGQKNLIQVEKIGPYETKFSCFKVQFLQAQWHDKVSLFFGENSYFYRWFPLEIKTIEDLVKNYDAIVAGMTKLPNKPALEKGYVNGRYVVNVLAPEFVHEEDVENGGKIYCDMGAPIR